MHRIFSTLTAITKISELCLVSKDTTGGKKQEGGGGEKMYPQISFFFAFNVHSQIEILCAMLPFFIYHVQNGMRVHKEMLHQIPFSDLLVCLEHGFGIEILLIFDTELQTYF